MTFAAGKGGEQENGRDGGKSGESGAEEEDGDVDDDAADEADDDETRADMLETIAELKRDRRYTAGVSPGAPRVGRNDEAEAEHHEPAPVCSQVRRMKRRCCSRFREPPTNSPHPPSSSACVKRHSKKCGGAPHALHFALTAFQAGLRITTRRPPRSSPPLGLQLAYLVDGATAPMAIATRVKKAGARWRGSIATWSSAKMQPSMSDRWQLLEEVRVPSGGELRPDVRHESSNHGGYDTDSLSTDTRGTRVSPFVPPPLKSNRALTVKAFLAKVARDGMSKYHTASGRVNST